MKFKPDRPGVFDLEGKTIRAHESDVVDESSALREDMAVRIDETAINLSNRIASALGEMKDGEALWIAALLNAGEIQAIADATGVLIAMASTWESVLSRPDQSAALMHAAELLMEFTTGEDLTVGSGARPDDDEDDSVDLPMFFLTGRQWQQAKDALVGVVPPDGIAMLGAMIESLQELGRLDQVSAPLVCPARHVDAVVAALIKSGISAKDAAPVIAHGDSFADAITNAISIRASGQDHGLMN